MTPAPADCPIDPTKVDVRPRGTLSWFNPKFGWQEVVLICSIVGLGYTSYYRLGEVEKTQLEFRSVWAERIKFRDLEIAELRKELAQRSERIIRVESDVSQVRGDITEIKGDVKEIVRSVRR